MTMRRNAEASQLIAPGVPFWMHVGSTRGSRSASGQPLETCRLHFGVHFGLQHYILEPFGSHFGSILGLPEPFWVHFGPSWGSRSTSGQLTPFWDQFWNHFGAIFGANLAPKTSPETRANLRPFLTPFWDQFWGHFGIQIGPILMSSGSCAESPGAASPRDGVSLFFLIPRTWQNH